MRGTYSAAARRDEVRWKRGDEWKRHDSRSTPLTTEEIDERKLRADSPEKKQNKVKPLHDALEEQESKEGYN